MMLPYTEVSIKGIPRDRWLEERRKGIGGSDASGILGVNKYASPYSVWADKTGHADNSDSEAARQGRDLEDYVAKRFVEQTGLRISRVNSMMVSTEHPFMRANVDRRVYGLDSTFVGLECKTSGDIYLTKFQNGDYPIEYYTQCQHYMAVTGARRWYLCVLVFQKEPMVFEIPRDEEDIQRLIKAEEAFWTNHVLTGIAPPTDGSNATANALKRMYPDTNGATVTASDESLLERLWEAKADAKRADERVKELTNAVKADMGEALRITGLEYSATLKPQTRTQIDRAALAKAHPKIDLTPFTKSTVTRVLTVDYAPIDAGLKEAS